MSVRRSVPSRRVAVFILLAGVLAASLSACTSAKKAGSTTSSVAPATRWWSNASVTVGSTIDPAHPTAAAAQLHQSRGDYCTMLKQTLAVGKSILPSGAAADPRLLTTTDAFVAEIQAVAPAAVQAPWHVLAPVIIQLVRSGGALPTSVPTGTSVNLQAAIAINNDAKANCHVDLSKVVTQ